MSIFRRQGCTASVFVCLIFICIWSCDSNTNGPSIQRVDSRDLLTEEELLQTQNRSNDTYAKTDDESIAHKHKFYYFGFDLRASPQEDAAQYLPFLTYLEQTTGYKFKLHFTPKDSTTADELGQDRSQFAAMGAGSYLFAHLHYSAMPLVRGVNGQGKAEYQSVLVVRPNSEIKSIEDIRGRKFGFGSRNSTQGHIIPRIMLREKGLTLDDLADYVYTGSHQNCAEAVVSGKVDVCGMQDRLGTKLASEGVVRILQASQYYPSSGIVANKFVNPEVVAKVKQALLDFRPQGKHGKNLYNWDRTEMPQGFTNANVSDYEDLRNWSVEFGILSQNVAQGN